MLRITPGALSSELLEQRPAGLPAHLYVHGGRGPTAMDAVIFAPRGPELHPLEEAEALAALRAGGTPLWLRVRGLAEPARIGAVLERLAVPPVLIPPLLEVPQRPQVECLGDVILVVLHRLGFARDPAHLVSDQVGLLLLPGLLITIEEASHGGGFPDLTGWLLSRAGTVEDRDLDDILHFLVDDMLDALFPMLERIAHRLDELEEGALRRPSPTLLTHAFRHRTNLRTIRNQIWPLRHPIRVLLRERQSLLGPEAREGFREMEEIVELLFENCELLRAQCDAITQAYAASVGNRMNQVMKTLTILTSIFAPLTFIAGIYGMNFEHMPELRWRLGYAAVLAAMAAVAAIQAYWLWRRGWFQDWTAQR
ncbi:MAG: magnesium/cobalt transporter CorA [Synechococcaceae cyanobacterium]|nr:magnesium/cobalt transporter CorA [Synechococcaceae cyanobacterium]